MDPSRVKVIICTLLYLRVNTNPVINSSDVMLYYFTKGFLPTIEAILQPEAKVILKRHNEAFTEEGAAVPTAMDESMGFKVTFLQSHGIYVHTVLLTSVTFVFTIDSAPHWGSCLTFHVRIEQ